MKVFFVILSLIYFLLAHQSLAKPESNSVQLIKSRLGLSYVNCVTHCVQPIGEESDEEPIQTRSIISNYGTLYDCLKKCGSN